MVVVSFCSTPQSKSQPIQITAPCMSDPCEAVYWNENHFLFRHPLFPLCDIIGTFRWKYCPDIGNVFEITYMDYAYGASTDCTNLKNWLNADRSRIGQLYDLAVESTAKYWFRNNMYYGDTVFCPAPNSSASMTSYQAKCNSFCFYEDVVNAHMIVVPKKCTSTTCCKVTRNLCWDKATQTIVETKTVISLGTDGDCTISSVACSAFITRSNLTGIETHQVPLDWAEDCVISGACQ